MHIFHNKKAIALIFVYFLVSVTVILLAALYRMNIQSIRETQKRQNWNRAFYAAESGIDVGLINLPILNGTPPLFSQSGSLGTPTNSQYQVDIYEFPAGAIPDYSMWRISSTGYAPSATVSPRYEVELEAIAELSSDSMPDGFFDYALYSGGDVETASGACHVNGDIFYNATGTATIKKSENVGNVVPGIPIDFLNDIDYDNLRAVALSQEDDGLVHIVTSITWGLNMPTTFWYNQSEGIPNVIFVEGPTALSITAGGTVGGLIIVTCGDCSITGSLIIDGCILTKDDLKLGGSMTIAGGAWAGDVIPNDNTPDDGIHVGGSATINYNAAYMDAIQDIMASESVRVASWQEIRRQVN